MKWLKDDGTLDLNALDQLEANVRAVTDSNASIDQVIKGAKLGAPTVVAFRCAHTGMYYPADYAKQWGRSYGIGLGSSPVSESLDTQYHVAPSDTSKARHLRQLMHPVATSNAQVDYMVVPEDQFNAAQLIAAEDDPEMQKRIDIIYQKQMVHPDSRLRMLVAQYNLLNTKAVVK